MLPRGGTTFFYRADARKMLSHAPATHPFDFSLRVEIGECDTCPTFQGLLLKIRPLTLMFTVQGRTLKSSKSSSEKCSKIITFNFDKC